MKTKKLVCNLKSGITLLEFQNLLQRLKNYDSNTELILASPYPYINLIKSPIKKASQDISKYNDEYAVGEVTGNILKSIETEYVLIGHSDRRLRHNETEQDYIKKITNALSNDIKVIFCVGETLEQKLRKKTYMILEREIARVFNKIEGNIQNIIIAYEPVWAISNNKGDFDSINVSEISEIIQFIKKLVKDYYDIDIEVLYGGSVSAKNIDMYRNLKSDGLLIGQASFDAESIKRIASKI